MNEKIEVSEELLGDGDVFSEPGELLEVMTESGDKLQEEGRE